MKEQAVNWVPYLLVVAGIIAHFINRMASLEASGTVLSPLKFLGQRPYAAMLAVVGAFLLAYFLDLMGQLNEVAGLGCGVACNEAFDSLRSRSAGRIKALSQEPKEDVQ